MAQASTNNSLNLDRAVDCPDKEEGRDKSNSARQQEEHHGNDEHVPDPQYNKKQLMHFIPFQH
eukprot:4045618-Amphidinium_carterae.1